MECKDPGSTTEFQQFSLENNMLKGCLEGEHPTSSLPSRNPGAKMTSEGSVASNAEKLVKPVLPDTKVALMCSAWGNNRAFLQ
eukprot:673765-Pelagomonas_calceolata.AAC.11